ncbi:VOC family protein [Bacteroidota bacterium]
MISQPAYAQLNDCYNKIDRIIWVVQDVEYVKEGWQKLGFGTFVDHENKKMVNDQIKNKQVSYTIKHTSASLGGLKAVWIQPIEGKSIYSDHLKKHGPGAFAILHRVNSMKEMNSEIEKMRKQEVKVLQTGGLEGEKGEIKYVLFDTFEEGKYLLGLSFTEDSEENAMGVNKNEMKFSQVAFAVKDVNPVIKYWSEKGFQEFNVVYPDGWDKEYYGKPADFQMELAFQHPGSGVAYEWCIPKKPPTVYADHIKKYGESIQHFGFNIPDMDLILKELKNQGLTVSQSGGWGEKEKPGSGRYAYVNMEEWGGESIELLWSYKE